jgi:hypothetical protein
MPPPNDNFANATAISGASGNQTGSNVGAGVEAGEPYELQSDPTSSTNQNPGFTTAPSHTVWWAWTCPTNGDYYFETRGNDFKSVLQAFTGDPTTPVVSGLAETPYLMNQSAGFGNGFENGGLVAFTATAGTVYYIRVDGRGGATGNIFLQWNTYVAARLGSCGGCPIDFQSEICLDTIQITDVTTDGFYYFGNIPSSAGLFKVRRCSGANNYGIIFTGAISIWDDALNYSTGDQVLSTNDKISRVADHNGVYRAYDAAPSKHPTVMGWHVQNDPIAGENVAPPYCPLVAISRQGTWGWSPQNDYSKLSTGVAFGTGVYPFTDDLHYDIYVPGSPAGTFQDTSSGPDCGYAGSNLTNTADGLVTGTLIPTPAYQPGWGGPWNNSGIGLNGAVCSETALFCAQDGIIGVAFATNWQSGYDPNHPGNCLTWVSALSNPTPNPNPTFQLIFNPLLISMLAPAGCSISGSGTSWSLSINVQNLSVIAWPGVSFALQNSGGISGASAAVTSDLAANSTTSGIGPITFTADPTPGLITATIQVSLCGVVAFNLTFPLYPVVALSYYGTNTGGCAVACVNTFVQAIVIASPFPGLANVTLTGTSSPLSLINPLTGLVVSSTAATVGNGTTYQALRLAVRDPGTPTSNTFTVAVSWRGFTLTPYTFVRTIS